MVFRKEGKMKAYIVFVDDPLDGCTLVFEKTRGKAKTWWWDIFSFIDVSANRVKQYDKFIKDDKPVAFMDNSDLLAYAPKAPPFYTQEEL